MKNNIGKTLGEYVNSYPFIKTNIQRVNIRMDSDGSLVLSVSRPKIWHMNVKDAIDNMDETFYGFKINSFDQDVIKTAIEYKDQEKILNIFIGEYEDSPIEFENNRGE